MVVSTADRTGPAVGLAGLLRPSRLPGLLLDFQARATHSENLRSGARSGIAIFDSSQPIDTGEWRVRARCARETPPRTRPPKGSRSSQSSVSHGGEEISAEDVSPPAATASTRRPPRLSTCSTTMITASR
mgnify:CR=1 FL=1